MRSLLKITSLFKNYQTFTALKDINLTVHSGEFVALIGPNGCGKTTLLKLIADIEKPDSGSIILSTQAAYMPQSHSLLPWRTLRENLLLPLELHRGQDPIGLDKLLKEFNLFEFKNLYPHELSGGMRQKAALIRTVVYNSQFLLLDEPFAALDSLTRLEAQTWLQSLRRKFTSTILMVTHDIREAIALADTIYVMSPHPGTIRHKFKVAKDNQTRIEKTLMRLLLKRAK